MNHKFAQKTMKYLADKAIKDGDGYFAVYFDRKNGKFAGTSVGMMEPDGYMLIDSLIEKLGLDKAKVVEHIQPTPAIIMPIKGKFPENPDGAA